METNNNFNFNNFWELFIATILLILTVIAAIFAIRATQSYNEINSIDWIAQDDNKAYDVLQNYLIDVIDETDFWYECDSTQFNSYKESTPEWMLQVIISYTIWDNNRKDYGKETVL